MTETEKKLADGVKLSVIQTDKFKSSVFMITYVIELTKENAANATLLTSVLKRGCAEYPTMREIDIRREELYSGSLGASVTKRGEMLFVTLYVSFLENRYLPDNEDLFAEMLGMLRQVYYNPLVRENSFDRAYVKTEKKNLIDSINKVKNNKSRYAHQRCVSIMCEGEKYSIPSYGYADDVAAIDGASLYSFYLALIANAPVRLTYVGGLGTDEVGKYVSRCLPEFAPRGDAFPQTDRSDPMKPYKEVIEELPAEQGKLTIGMRVNTPYGGVEYPSFILFNEIYGGSATSKLFKIIREKQSLCYYCNSGGDGCKGVLFVSSGIENANFERTRDGIVLQLREMCDGNITDDEMTAAKKSLCNSYRSYYDSAVELAEWYIYRSASGLTGSPADAIEGINSLSKQDVVSAAKRVRVQTVYFLKGNGGAKDEDNDEN